MMRRRHRRERFGCEPFVARACPHCGSTVMIVRCADCESWFAVCDCEGASFDRYLSGGGRCVECRVWERFEELHPRREPKG